MAETFKPLTWDELSDHKYEMGVKKGVLYNGTPTAEEKTAGKAYSNGVAWNGLTGVTESPSGAEPTKIYADDSVYATLMSLEELGATVECVNYPEEFDACNGIVKANGVLIAQQTRTPFGMSYVTTVGNAAGGESYKIHLLYGALASPSEKAYTTINESPENMTFSYELTTTPVAVSYKDGDNTVELKKTALLVIDAADHMTNGTKSAGLVALEAALYGTTTAAPYLPTPEKVFELLATTA